MLVGHVAETIADYAVKHHCNAIMMGTRGMALIKNLSDVGRARWNVHRDRLPFFAGVLCTAVDLQAVGRRERTLTRITHSGRAWSVQRFKGAET